MKNRFIFIVICTIVLTACGGTQPVKPSPSSPQASKQTTGGAASTGASKPGGYYLDDGPGDNPPQNIDGIPSAVPKNEPYLTRANKPYKALGATYTPMSTWQPYKERGVASWYGKRYHGKKTASGEVYDMYSMSAAHTTLPLPSYVKVTNPANGRSVIVRVNDRGPFKSSRLIDLSYAAAYQLRFASSGSTLVEIEAINPNNAASYAQAAPAKIAATTNTSPGNTSPNNPQTKTVSVASSATPVTMQYFVQAGAFKSEANAQALVKRIQSLEIAPNVGINSVYNNDLYRLKLGPYDNKPEADIAAAKIRKQLNLPAIIINQ
ncbi:MAG: septal ring lytic transglycosylase RlpA family protein [Pseudomonadota bacterium]